MSRVRNAPVKIYLQIDDSDATRDNSITDWNELLEGAITWSSHRINKSDIEYTLKNQDNEQG